ncbi:disks large-associated protein 3 isoform X2 [Rana temporaria]|uniref:disks large-associated protein 3 isoform X2 n=1 Tax=Rana temporaria TaxID=8407 RepID=UPI001AAD631B|nr:disks large-associated protein 3 isoform X2 [Rana temporaria]
MKGYHGEGSQLQPPCYCIPEGRERVLDFPHHIPDFHKSYPRSASESCSLDLHYCPPRSVAVTQDCPGGPVSMPEPRASSGGTYPRMHHNPQQFDCDECMAAIAHTSSKINRLPPTLLDQFEKQLPLHHDGFHTLQYQRTSTTEQRSESPSRIRHLVHSVQKLFAKSHSLETPSKREYNGMRYEGRGGGEGYQHSQPRHSKRSKSKDRKSDPKHRSKMAGWWSSDDNLDSDSSFLVSARHAMEHGAPFGVDTPESAFRDLTLKSLKSGGGEGKCLACAGMSMSLDGQTLKRSTWHTMTVSQAREAYPGSGHHQDKMLMLQEAKGKERGYHYLQVPPDEWGGYPAPGKEGEIPCRRMRSGSYIKAMGDDDSGDSDTSTKMSPPKGANRRERYRRSSSVDHPRTNCCTTPKIHQRGHGYGLSITGQRFRHSLDTCARGIIAYPDLGSGLYDPRDVFDKHCYSPDFIKGEINHQSGATCGSVFSEVESHAVEALDLPGCFRMRSHSYLRAIQAGCSQDDDCISVFSMSGPSGQTLASSILKPNTSFSYRKAPPPIPPRLLSKPLISVTAQSSTESTHETFLHNEPTRLPWSKDGKVHCNSSESLEGTKARNLSLDLATVQQRTSPKPSTVISKALPLVKREELKSAARQRKWRPSIGVQVETISDSDTEGKSRREFHSIGVQVEDDRRKARFKRSNSVTAGVQADLELEGFPGLTVPTEDKGLQFGCSFQRHSSEPSDTSQQYSVYKTVHTQGQWAYREDYQMQYDTAEEARQESWIDRATRSLPDSGRASPCHRDGEWFIKMLQAEVERMEGWCQQMERDAEEYDIPEEILEKIRSAVGSSQLLMSQKVQQFFRLCQQNMDPTSFPLPTSQDLAGFWDLLQLSFEDVGMKFAELQQLKENGWKLLETKEEKKLPPPIPKKPLRQKVHPVKDRSLDSVDRQRQEARKRLLAAKRAASYRHNSATESADSIEIYIPEAQTRL